DSKTKTTTISVVIPNYNRVGELYRSLKSISYQTRLPDEIIIVDDCSDASIYKYINDVYEEFYPEFTLITLRNNINMGANYCRNRAMKQASSDFIAFLDSDDIWLPQKIEKQVKLIQAAKTKASSSILCATARYRVTSDGTIMCGQNIRNSFSYLDLCHSNLIGPLSSVMVSREAALAIDGFNERLPASQDWDFYLRLFSETEFINCRDRLCVYFDHDKNRISKNARNRLKGLIYIFDRYVSSKSTFRKKIFLNIAEELQNLGRLNFAAKFYYYYNYGNSRFMNNVLYKFYTLIRKIFPLHSLKNERYKGYRKAGLLQQRSDKFNVDQLYIRSILNASSPT
ncbi:MAG: glycosyltransferase family A protein, partial [Lentilitoribacter sp.]